jgi:23S rRNA pseudouridine955/2504/2580 synthase
MVYESICSDSSTMSDEEGKDQPVGRSARYVVASEADAGQRIDNFLLRELKNVPRSLIYRILRKGEVRVDGGRIKPEYRLELGDRIRVPPIRLPEAKVAPAPSRGLRDLIDLAVLYEDKDLIVLNKPAGVAVHGGSGVSLGVIETMRASRPELKELELVHRLDRETSGCLLIAKRRSALRALHASLRERDMEKHYAALLCGRWTLKTKTLDLPLKTNYRQGGERVVKVDEGGVAARSTFKPVEFFAKRATLMDVLLDTGRTHQIRVHAAYTGHAVAGDDKYGKREDNAELASVGLRRMFLHAKSLKFVHPGTGKDFSIEAPLDNQLESVLSALRDAGLRKREASTS